LQGEFKFNVHQNHITSSGHNGQSGNVRKRKQPATSKEPVMSGGGIKDKGERGKAQGKRK